MDRSRNDLEISVVIPAYNAEKWIGRAIVSVLNQTVMPVEIIVVDDGSDDNTSAVVKSLGNEVKYIYQINSGPGKARNQGIENSKSEWIAFLDADDEWLPNWIDTQIRILRSCPNVMWSFCNFEHDCDDFWQTIPPLENDHHIKIVYYYDAVLRGMRIGTPGFLIHRSVFEKVGIFNPDIRSGQDLDLWERIAMWYPQIGYSPEICWLLHWQENNNSLSQSERPRDQQVKAICRNALLAQSLGKDTIDMYYPYARKRILSYILRWAAREVQIKKDTIDEAKTIFPLRFSERMIEKVFSILPTSVTKKIIRCLVD